MGRRAPSASRFEPPAMGQALAGGSHGIHCADPTHRDNAAMNGAQCFYSWFGVRP